MAPVYFLSSTSNGDVYLAKVISPVSNSCSCRATHIRLFSLWTKRSQKKFRYLSLTFFLAAIVSAYGEYIINFANVE